MATESSSLADSAAPLYVLRLYVCGMTPRSTRALAEVKQLCEEQLQGRYERCIAGHGPAAVRHPGCRR